MSRRILRAFALRCAALAARCALPCLVAGAAWLVPTADTAAAAAAAEPDWDRQRAEFVLNFAKFSYWPRSRFLAEGERFTLCQFRGSDRLARALGALEAQTVRGHRIAFRRIETLAQARDCMLLFAAGRAPQLRASDAVLTVGSGAAFAQQGGMVGLLQDGARLRFEVNLAALRRADILMSSQVLSLASHLIEASTLSAAEEQPSRLLPASAQAPQQIFPSPPAEAAVHPTGRDR